jgi:diguanylate cyclase (GGDEF)-like protein
MIVSREQMKMAGQREREGNLQMAAPINFRQTLVGALAIGVVNFSTGNEKRFLAMVADLVGIAIRNTEYLTTAKKEATTDPLTGLYNRRYFFDVAANAIQKAASYEFPLSIFIFDIDNFKNYNDTNGHTEGDVLLKEMGSLLKKNTRSTNVVARYGGEEFVVLLKECDRENAWTFADNIRKIIESHPFRHREKQPLGCVSVSGGVASFPQDGNSVKQILEFADKALYRSKEAGRNRVTKYE